MSFTVKKSLLYVIVTAYILFSIFIQMSGITPYYSTIVNPICWMIIFLYTIYISYSERKRFKAKTEKTQTVLIMIMIYLIIYYLSGMFFGYQHSPYSHEILPLFKNIWSYVLIIFFQEYVRIALCPNRKMKWYVYLFVIILFTLSELNFSSFFSNFIDSERGFKYICSVILPVVGRNCLFTYLAVVGGYGCNLCYRVPIMLANLIMPLFPHLEWFWISLFELLLVIVVFIKINYIHEYKTSRDTKEKVKSQKLVRQLPWLAAVVIFVCFVAKVFTYMPIAIVSNSMADVINRGDVVIVKKLNTEEKKNLNVNDVVEYNLEGSSIVHRIIEIKEKNDDETIYITKGDNNEIADLLPVSYDQINGKVLFKIAKIGYPSVYLNEFFEKNRPDVELGK